MKKLEPEDKQRLDTFIELLQANPRLAVKLLDNTILEDWYDDFMDDEEHGITHDYTGEELEDFITELKKLI